MNDVVRALVYLQATSAAGRVRARLKRLKQPKYLVGAIAGAAYLWFFVFRRMFSAQAYPGAGQHLPAEFAPLVAPLLALAAFVAVAYAWIVPNDRAALKFSEAETAFLFPAPLSRRGLVHFSVLRAQLAIFVSVFVMSLLLRRGGAIGVNPLRYATALWLVFATIRLHFLGASFTRERLLDVGLHPWLRRAAAVGVLLVVVGACVLWARARLAPPRLDDAAALRDWLLATLAHGPGGVVLAPFRWLTSPLLAVDGVAFLRALPAALALLGVHYAWVVRSNVAFEEASIALAGKRAARLEAARDGRLRLRTAPARARKPPFRLAPRGPAAVAFLWKGLIAAGPFWRARNVAIAAVAVAVLMQWLRADPLREGIARALGVGALVVAGWLTMVGPMLQQRGLRETVDQLDVLRAMPLRGWQIALGQLSTPVAMVVPFQWLLLFAGALAFAGPGAPTLLTPALLGALAFAALLLLPLLCALMLSVPFAGVLLFPAWSMGGRGGGIDVMGQRLIFGGVYLLALALALLPATAVAGGLLALLGGFGGWPLAVTVATLAGTAVLAGELVTIVRWLGRRVERMDPSTEVR